MARKKNAQSQSRIKKDSGKKAAVRNCQKQPKR